MQMEMLANSMSSSEGCFCQQGKKLSIVNQTKLNMQQQWMPHFSLQMSFTHFSPRGNEDFCKSLSKENNLAYISV